MEISFHPRWALTGRWWSLPADVDGSLTVELEHIPFHRDVVLLSGAVAANEVCIEIE